MGGAIATPRRLVLASDHHESMPSIDHRSPGEAMQVLQQSVSPGLYLRLSSSFRILRLGVVEWLNDAPTHRMELLASSYQTAACPGVMLN